MQKLFNKILVPIDFSSGSRSVMEKAVDIAKQYNCSIFFLHVVTVSPMTSTAMPGRHLASTYNMLDDWKRQELELKMKNLFNYIPLLSNTSIKVEYDILKGGWDDRIIDLVNEQKFDLVLIGQKGMRFSKRNMLINPDRIATKTTIPVITVPSNRRLTKLYSIVIPITDFLPVRKLMYGVYIASRHDTTVKLLGIENEKTKDKVTHYLEKAYQLIRDNCNVKVELETIANNNVGNAVNQFALHHPADLVIVNPGTQSKMPGFFSSFLGNIIQRYSMPPVLTINPS